MNHEQLAFFNHQLAAMLQSGLPLESSLKQLSATMQRGQLRAEIEQLEADLEQGVPLEEALGRRKLPELYVAMLRAGLKSNNLPGVLTLAADYYSNLHATWLRLKGLMVYPAIVLITSLIVSALIAVIYTHMIQESRTAFGEAFFSGRRGPSLGLLLTQIWWPVILIALLTLAFGLILSVRSWRHRARWRLPGFREACLSQLASTIATMLEHGTNLDAALEVVQRHENSVEARAEIARWRDRLAGGARKFADVAQASALAPPLFIWLVTGAGENLGAGFRRAASLYEARAKHRIDLALYAALPVVILFIAGIISLEMVPLVRAFTKIMNDLGSVDGE